MKLHYFKPSKGNGNFGDNINPWLWEKLIPDFLDEDKTVAFIGIGTLINDSLPLSTPMAKKRIIFSTGVGYGKLSTINIDSSYHIYCVRGPLSAFKLGLSVDYGVTDGAILVKNVFDYKLKKNHKYSYMPHHNSVNKNWKIICQQLNISYIDPSLPVEEVLSEIAQTEI
ncbi:MAG: polysaccharide pyruvyl transferase family protein, partial [Xenococcus sp. (in: cyanobacteria)]